MGAFMMSSSRWIAAGAAILGVGALLSISWLVYVSQSHSSYWSWEGVLGLVLSGLGAFMLILGFFMPENDAAPKMEQHGDRGSTNYQAGRDIRLGGDS
jgi:hypothetical protein